MSDHSSRHVTFADDAGSASDDQRAIHAMTEGGQSIYAKADVPLAMEQFKPEDFDDDEAVVEYGM